MQKVKGRGYMRPNIVKRRGRSIIFTSLGELLAFLVYSVAYSLELVVVMVIVPDTDSVIAHFLPRNAMHSADYAVAKCLSVCHCHTPVFCRNGYTYPRTFSTSEARPFYFFCTANGMVIFRRGPPNGGVSCKGVWKIAIFRRISHFIWEIIQDRATVTMESE